MFLKYLFRSDSINGQICWNNSITDATFLSCTSKDMVKRNIGQFKHILGPSFDQQDIFDQQNRFLGMYFQIQCVSDGISAFHL